MSKQCTKCGCQMSDESRFCPGCGSDSSSLLCPNCGKVLQPNSRFCGGCGFDTQAPTATMDSVMPVVETPMESVTPIIESQPEPEIAPQQTMEPLVSPQPEVIPEVTPAFSPEVAPVVAPVVAPIVAPQQPPVQPQYAPPQYAQPPVQQPQVTNFIPNQAYALPATKVKEPTPLIPIIIIILLLIAGAVGILYITGAFEGNKTSASANHNDDDSSKVTTTTKKGTTSEADVTTKKSATTTKKAVTTTSSSTVKSNDLDKYKIFTTSKYNRGYQIPIATMMYGVCKNDYDTFISAYPQCVIDTYNDKLSTDKEKKDFINDIYTKYSEKVGENFTVKCATTKEVKLTDIEISALEKTISSTYDGDLSIDEAYTVTFSLDATGDTDTGNSSTSIQCISVKGKWYVIE